MQPGQPVQGMALRHGQGAGHRRWHVVALVLVEDIDTPLVAFGFRPRGGQERVDETQRFLCRVHASADADHLSIVVLAGQRCGLHAPRQRAADSGHLVGSDLLAIAGAADHDAEAVRVGQCLGRRGDAERRVVVLGVVGVRAAVDRLVTTGFQVLDDGLLEFVSGMV